MTQREFRDFLLWGKQLEEKEKTWRYILYGCIGSVVFVVGTLFILFKVTERPSLLDLQSEASVMSSLKKEGFNNWCKVDTRWGHVKVQCFNDYWKKKEVVIK